MKLSDNLRNGGQTITHCDACLMCGDEMWDSNVPYNFRTTDDPSLALGRWVQNRRQDYRKRSLRLDRIEQLDTIGLKW